MESILATEMTMLLLCFLALRPLIKEFDYTKALLFYLGVGTAWGILIGWMTELWRSSILFLAQVLLGVLVALFYTLYVLMVKKGTSGEEWTLSSQDQSPGRFYITGDKHRDFKKVKAFCRAMKTEKKDVLIILGDAGFNYYGNFQDQLLKEEAADLNITLFCIHGNKENRPQNIGTYGIRNFCGGKVYYEPQYPNILFAIDGEVYDFNGKKYLVIGGAHSVDKQKCLAEELPYWEDEMPDDAVKQKVEQALFNEENEIFGLLSHTCPLKYLPTEMFLSNRQYKQKKVHGKAVKKAYLLDIDRSTEEWLGTLEERIDYAVWYCGHYHVDKEIDRIRMLHHNIQRLETGGTDDS